MLIGGDKVERPANKVRVMLKLDGVGVNRDDYNSLTSDIFQVILLNVRPLILHLSNAMYGFPIKSRDYVVIDGFCPIISENL